MPLKCPRCESEDVSGGYVACNECGKEWHPGETDESQMLALVQHLSRLSLSADVESTSEGDTATLDHFIRRARMLLRIP